MLYWCYLDTSQVVSIRAFIRFKDKKNCSSEYYSRTRKLCSFIALVDEQTATCELLQGRQGEGNDQEALLLRIVRFNLEGAAEEWFRWMTRNGLKANWDRFVESVKSRFEPSKYEDPQGALLKLLQLGTVEDYQREELLVSKPTTLGDTFAFARNTEAPLEGHAAILTSTTTKTVADVTPQRHVRAIFLLLMIDEEDDMRVAIKDGRDDAVKTRDILILNSLIGHGSPRSLQLWGKLVTHEYAHQTIEFTLLDTTYSLKGDDLLYMKKISLHQMQAMLEHDDVYGVYEIYYLSIETEVGEMSPETVISRLVEPEQLFIRFDLLF
nr:hypothetical protein [Tanacetum cinerariifolium]